MPKGINLTPRGTGHASVSRHKEMLMSGVLKEILTCSEAGAKMKSVPEAELQVGKGIIGDRYFHGKGTFSERLSGMPDVEITLIEKEEVDAFNAKAGTEFSPEDFRRNLVTTGVCLNDLVGREFTVGSVSLKGIRLCEPCAHLAGILGNDIMQHMVHKAGLRAQVVVSGTIKVNDIVNG
jgi:MOSC domain-containing protein YiiM